MRGARRWLIAGLLLAVAIGGGAAFFHAFVDTEYSKAEFYADTELGPAAGDPGWVRYEARPGRAVLAVERGEPHGIVTTYHGYIERVAVEIPTPAAGDRIDLAGPGARVYFVAYHDGRIPWAVGPGGVRGHLDIESASERRVAANYEVFVAGHTERLLPEYRDREFTFRGRATFQARPRPDDKRLGDLWPKPAPGP
jgi:hypothetical protein